MKKLYFLLILLMPLLAKAQNLIFLDLAPDVPICDQFEINGEITITDPSQIQGGQLNLLINNSVNLAQPPSPPNPPIPGGGLSVTFPDLPPCVDGGPIGSIHPIRYEGITIGSSSSVTATIINNPSASVTIQFHGLSVNTTVAFSLQIRLDCSLIPPVVGTQHYLVQNFINGSMPSQPNFKNLILNINYPFLANPTVISHFPGNFGETVYMIFKYENLMGPANIEFQFEDLSVCTPTAYTMVGTYLYYLVQSTTAPPPNPGDIINQFLPGTSTWEQVTIPAGNSIYIKQIVEITGCTDDCTTREVKFTWRCPGANNLDLCDECQKDYTQTFIFDLAAPNFTVKRITPALNIAQYDPTCPNNYNLDWWDVEVKNNGPGTLPEINVTLYGPTGLNVLTLIQNDPSKLHIVQPLTCNGCTADIPVSQKVLATSGYACEALVPNALSEFNVKILNLKAGDDVVFRFSTYRCCDNHEDMFNETKIFNHWRFGASCITKCGFVYGKNDIVSDPLALQPIASNISTNFNTATHDIKQDLMFTTTVTDLTAICPYAPPCTTIYHSPYKDFTIKNDDLFGGSFDWQVLGYQGGSTPLTGIIKAEIFCEEGLIIKDPVSFPNTINYSSAPGGGGTQWNHVAYELEPGYGDGTNFCSNGTYTFYFRMSDVTNPLLFLEGGYFNFELRGCCPKVLGNSKYKVSFSLLMNEACHSFDVTTTYPIPICSPNSGGDCCWLPLNFREKDIAVHCPGCLAPGIIVSDYEMRRATYGKVDNNNDGVADGPGTDISTLPTLPTGLNLERGIYGDRLTDILTAHLQPGDQTYQPIPGYNYNLTQFGSNAFYNNPWSARLKYLQLHRYIQYSKDTEMDLNVESFELEIYEDQALQIQLLHMTVTNPAHIQHYLERNGNDYFYSFFDDELDGPNPPLSSTYTNTGFTGYFENQRYILRVNYKVCGNFSSPAGIHDDNIKMSDVERESSIENNMWLTGHPYTLETHGPVPEMPNDIAALNADGWTFGQTGGGLTQINQTFADGYKFKCEAFGGAFYFYSVDLINLTSYSNMAGGTNCERSITVNARSSIARKFHIFEYEFRVPPIIPGVGSIIYPSPNLYNLITGTGNPAAPTLNGFTNFNFSNSGGSIQYDPFSGSPALDIVCANENGIGMSGNLIAADEEYTHQIVFNLKPTGCGPAPPVSTDPPIYQFGSGDSQITFDDNLPLNCIPTSACNLTGKIIDNAFAPINWNLNSPNLKLTVDPAVLEAGTKKICWDFTIKNMSQQGQHFTLAPNVYFAGPVNSDLFDWEITINGTTTSSSNGIMSLGAIAVNGQITGTICAKYNCNPAGVSFDLTWGWNCNGIPTTQNITSACQYELYPLDIINVDPLMVVDYTNTTVPTTYSACGPLTYKVCFKNLLVGSALPQSFTLEEFNSQPYFSNAQYSVTISNCLTTTSTTLAQGVTTISAQNLDDIGIGTNTDGYMTQGECLCVEYNFLLGCIVEDTLYPPAIVLQSLSNCNNIINTPAYFDPMTPGTSYCNNCYTITKSANVHEVLVQDYVTFDITVCGNNNSNSPVTLVDNLPNNFTPDPPLNLPTTIYFTNDGTPTGTPINGYHCFTYQVSGYFTKSGAGILQCNTAEITLPNATTMSDTGCVYVVCTLYDLQTFSETTISQYNLPTPPLAYSGKKILVNGLLIIDQSINFKNCTFIMESGAQIKVSGTELFAEDCNFFACHDMWKGIWVRPSGSSVVLVGSTIQDAENGIELEHGDSYCHVERSSFLDCVRGIYAPPHVNNPNLINNAKADVIETRFATVLGLVKDPYSGQTPFGAIGKAGIEAHRVIWTIGDDAPSIKANTFQNLNMGIIGHTSNLKIRNCEFENIHVDPGYPVLPYNGSAIVSLGTKPISSYLSVTKPANLSQHVIIYDADYGIFTSLSSANIQNVRMDNVTTGMYTTNCKNNYTEVINCTIDASHYGLYWKNNANAKHMKARQNTITVNSAGTGIHASEIKPTPAASETADQVTPVIYEIVDNNITLSGGTTSVKSKGFGNAGIYTLNIEKPVVYKNKVNVFPVAGGGSKAIGISVDGCYNAWVSCNDITGSWPSAVLNHTKGIQARESNHSNIGCNIVDHTWRGISFLGENLSSTLRGNNFFEHFEGLFVDGAGVIGTQERHGNIWSYPSPSNGWQARNDNTNVGGVQASEFIVFQNPGSPYYPTQINATGWFSQALISNTFDCNGWVDENGWIHSALCNPGNPDPVSDDPPLDLKIAIATDMFKTVDWEDESQAKARLYLYNYLKQNPDVAETRQEFKDFLEQYESSVLNARWEVDEKLRNVEQYDSIFKAQMEAAYTLIKVSTDSINYIYRHDLQDQYANELENMYYQIGFLEQTIYNLKIQRQIMVEGNLDDAKFLNDYTVSAELPYENDRFVTHVYMQYLEQEFASDAVNYRPDAIVNNYSQLLSIAHQCPAAGGKAVFQARVMLSLINDSIQYDDENACLLAGIYREVPIEVINFKYELIPNPASNVVTLRILTEQIGLCDIEITNILGTKILDTKVDCETSEHIIQTHHLNPGTYLVKIRFEDFEKVEKLLIIR